MKIHRFFLEQKINFKNNDNEQVLITDSAVCHQISKVLRLKAGDQIVLLDNSGAEFLGKILLIKKNETVISDIKINFPKGEKQIFIHLAPSILKKDKYEWLLQKCTEMGVSVFTPIVSDRTEKIKINFERANKIIREASEQSERIFLPELQEQIDLENFLQKNYQDKNKKIYALQLGAEKINIEEIKNDFFEKNIAPIFLVGPEGGWSDFDLELFKKFGVKEISLGQGNKVLRAETASCAISAILSL